MDSLNPLTMTQLCEVLYSNSSVSLEQEANKIMISQTGAENAFFLLVCDNYSELTCKVLGEKILLSETRIEVQNTFFEEMLRNRTHFLCNSLKGNGLIINQLFDTEVRTVLCFPIFNPDNEKITNIICLINKKSTDDVEIVKQWSRFISPLLYKSQAFEEEKKLRKQRQALLHVVKNLLVQIDNVSLLLKEIMTEAKKLTGAERCSLFLLDKEQNELVAKVFDGNYTTGGTEESMARALSLSSLIVLPKNVLTLFNVEKHLSAPAVVIGIVEMLQGINIPLGEGIAGHVAVTGELLNIHDAYSHPLFYRKVDDVTGFKTRNILCFPIKDDKGVIGVAELCNKLNGSHFTHFDEELAISFSMYCAICIAHSLVWKRVRDAQRRSTLSNGLIIQSKISEEDVSTLFSEGLKPLDFFNKDFSRFSFAPRSLSSCETSMAVVSMMEDLGMVSHWKISRKVLTRFVMSVREGYRNPPYHNWMHAFSVAHFSFLLLKNLKLMETCLTPLQGLCLFVSCLCHDLDHRGTTSSFQVTSKSVLAALYSSEGSVLERHHFAQTMAILHSEGCNIFENLSEENYSKCLDYIRDIILATDLAHHFRIIKDIHKILQDGYDPSKQEDHNILLSLLVTSCDLSDQTKDWRNTKDIAIYCGSLSVWLSFIKENEFCPDQAEPDAQQYYRRSESKLLIKLIYKEFFSQGDLEKAMGLEPNEMMDRSKAQIPRLQISFLQTVVIPVYELLHGFFSDLQEVVEVVKKHIHQWEKVETVFQEHYRNDKSPLEFLDDERVDAAALTA